MNPAEGPRWTEVLAGLLSPFAVETLDRVDARRDPGVLCDPERLRRMLSELALPVFPSVIEYERRVGSVVETLLLFEQRVRGRCPLTMDALPRHEGRLLLPIGIWYDPFHEDDEEGVADYFMDEQGTCYVKIGVRCYPIAESYIVQFEQDAADIELKENMTGKRGRVRWNQTMCVLYQNIAPQIAGALGVPVVAAATDRYRGVWWNPDFFVTYRRPRGGGDATFIHMTKIEDALPVLRIIYDIHPRAHVTWCGERGAAPSPVEAVIDRLPAYGHKEEEAGEFVLVRGSNGVRLYWKLD